MSQPSRRIKGFFMNLCWGFAIEWKIFNLKVFQYLQWMSREQTHQEQLAQSEAPQVSRHRETICQQHSKVQVQCFVRRETWLEISVLSQWQECPQPLAETAIRRSQLILGAKDSLSHIYWHFQGNLWLHCLRPAWPACVRWLLNTKHSWYHLLLLLLLALVSKT